MPNTPSLESFADLIPGELLNRSGEVFYSGRAAFSRRSDVYLLGYNPGSNPLDPRLHTMSSSIAEMAGRPDLFSLYYAQWEQGRDPKMQQGIKHLFHKTGLDPCLTPSSNCVFVRSKGAESLNDRRGLEDACWPFHEAVISVLGIRLILCLGRHAFSTVRKRVRALRHIDEHREANRRAWPSYAFALDNGTVVVGLTHPGRVAWTSPASDPTPLVLRMLKRVHG